LDDHPPDVEGFSQIRDDDTKFSQFPQVLGEDTESITQFWENPSISPASEVDATGSHAPPTLEQALDNVPPIVADHVCVPLDSMQPPEQRKGLAAASGELARFGTNIPPGKLMVLVLSFVEEICGSHADDILDIMIDARRCEAHRQRLQHARKAGAEKKIQRRALAQPAHDRMVTLRHAQVCESIAAESEAEEFDSPEIEIVKDELPIDDASSSPFDLTSIDLFRKELDSLWEVSNQSERQRRYQKCPITMKLKFLVSSRSRPALRLLGRYLSFPCKRTIDMWFPVRCASIIDQ
jgi:hypothetical protein